MPEHLYQTERVTITRRGRAYYITYYEGSRRVRKSLGTTDAAAAVKRASEMEARLAAVEVGAIASVRETQSLDDIHAAYVASLTAMGSPKGTVRAVAAVKRSVLDACGWHLVGHVGTGWDEFLRKTPLTGQTIRQYVFLLSGMMRWAERKGMTTANPFRSLDLPEADEPRFRRDLTDDELARLIAAASPENRLRWLIYSFTGLRAVAGMSLRWEWINWEAGELTVPGTSQKNKKPLTLPLYSDLRTALLEWRGPTLQMGQILPDVDDDTVRAHLVQECKALGIDTRGICLHSIRHSFATRVYEASGHDIDLVCQLMGHSSVATTAKYLHTTSGAKRAAVDALRSLA
jgi:integrase